MRILALVGLLICQPVVAAEMTPVLAADGYCGNATDPGAICYEWKLTMDPAVRFIAHGFEDGIEYGFHRRSLNDEYKHIVRVVPVLKDGSRSGKLFWGYPWDIVDLALTDAGRPDQILAAFEHGLEQDGEVHSPAWQRRLPAVLFHGRTSQPEATVAPIRFKPSTVEELRSEAGV
jgi:hypothetical protein